MKNKLPYDSDFEKFVRQALQKTDGTPDENTWAHIAAQQNSRNIRLRFRHYGMRFAPVAVALMLAFAGWKYFVPGNASPAKSQPEMPQQTAPSQQPQVNAGELLPGSGVSENMQAKIFQGKSRAAHLRSRIPATTVRFAAEEGLRYENPATGTAVYIPANALVRPDGRPVSGEVEFELREYRNMAEFMVSGIPMHYADERGSFFFNSGGMFDLRVNQGGEPLQMAAGQACDVQFAPTHKLTQASLYYFDEAENTWKYRPDPAFATSALPPVVTEATVVRDNRGLQQACLPNELASYEGIWSQSWEAQAAVWMQDAVETGYDYAFGKKTMPGWFRKHPHWTNDQLLTGLERSAIRMKRHKDTDDMFFPEDINNVFTELKAFKDCYFVIKNGSGTKKSFTQEEFDSYWERFSVVQEYGATCYVSFFGKQGLLQFYATLTGSTENPGFDPDKVMAEYTHLRHQRQQNFEKQANSWRRFLQMAQIFQEPEEWCMDAVSWFDYFEANLPLMRKRYAALKEQDIAHNKQVAVNIWQNWKKRVRDIISDNYKNKRSFDNNMAREAGLDYALRVTQFGLYNCDQIFKLGRGQEIMYVQAAYESAGGQRIVPKTACVIERNARLFFTLPGAEKMIYLPGRRFEVILTDDKGRYYRLPGDQYAAIDPANQKSHTFTVEDVTEKTKTPREWAELLEI